MLCPLPNPYELLNYSSCRLRYKTTHTVLRKERREVNLEKLFVHPNAYCYWLILIVLFMTNQNSPGPTRLYRYSPVHSSLPGINNAMH